MSKYFISLALSVYFTAVACVNIKTEVIAGPGNVRMEPFKKIGEKYYLIEGTQNKTWFGAVHFCRSIGAHLTSIETKEEWQALSTHLVKSGYAASQYFWIGGNDFDKLFEFYWISTGQKMAITKWEANEPNNRDNRERCVHLWAIGNEWQMNDYPCFEQLHYICKANDPKTVSVTVW